jgi:hypothetical protein
MSVSPGHELTRHLLSQAQPASLSGDTSKARFARELRALFAGDELLDAALVEKLRDYSADDGVRKKLIGFLVRAHGLFAKVRAPDSEGVLKSMLATASPAVCSGVETYGVDVVRAEVPPLAVAVRRARPKPKISRPKSLIQTQRQVNAANFLAIIIATHFNVDKAVDFLQIFTELSGPIRKDELLNQEISFFLKNGFNPKSEFFDSLDGADIGGLTSFYEEFQREPLGFLNNRFKMNPFIEQFKKYTDLIKAKVAARQSVGAAAPESGPDTFRQIDYAGYAMSATRLFHESGGKPRIGALMNLIHHGPDSEEPPFFINPLYRIMLLKDVILDRINKFSRPERVAIIATCLEGNLTWAGPGTSGFANIFGQDLSFAFESFSVEDRFTPDFYQQIFIDLKEKIYGSMLRNLYAKELKTSGRSEYGHKKDYSACISMNCYEFVLFCSVIAGGGETDLRSFAPLYLDSSATFREEPEDPWSRLGFSPDRSQQFFLEETPLAAGQLVFYVKKEGREDPVVPHHVAISLGHNTIVTFSDPIASLWTEPTGKTDRHDVMPHTRTQIVEVIELSPETLAEYDVYFSDNPLLSAGEVE